MTSDEKLTPAAQQLVPALRQKNRIERRSRPLTAVLWAAVAVITVALIYLLAHAQAADDATATLQRQGQERSAQIAGIQDQLKGVCRKVTDPAKLTPQEREGCFRAENSIPPNPVTVTQVPPAGSGLTVQQVQAMIAAALASVPRPLTTDQVTAVAQLVFAQQAPALMSPQKLADAVASFCAGDTCRGPAGQKGKDAPAATPEQIRAQVDAYCAANGGCAGPKGDPPACTTQPGQCVGPQGVSVIGFDDPGPHRTGPYIPGADTDPCFIVVHLIDPETGRTSEDNINVPVRLCYS